MNEPKVYENNRPTNLMNRLDRSASSHIIHRRLSTGVGESVKYYKPQKMVSI